MQPHIDEGRESGTGSGCVHPFGDDFLAPSEERFVGGLGEGVSEDKGVHIRTENSVVIFRSHTGALGGTKERAIKHPVWQKQNRTLKRLRVLRTPARRDDAVHSRLAAIGPTGETQHLHFPPRATPQQRGSLARDHLGTAVVVLVEK